MEQKEIDHSEVKDKIEQAYGSAFHLTEEQTRKLIQDKFDRAYRLREAMIKSNLFWRTDS